MLHTFSVFFDTATIAIALFSNLITESQNVFTKDNPET